MLTPCARSGHSPPVSIRYFTPIDAIGVEFLAHSVLHACVRAAGCGDRACNRAMPARTGAVVLLPLQLSAVPGIGCEQPAAGPHAEERVTTTRNPLNNYAYMIGMPGHAALTALFFAN